MLMFRFAQVFVLIVAMAWVIELTSCYFEKRRRAKQRIVDRPVGDRGSEAAPFYLATPRNSSRLAESGRD
jgi:hypothetical protein